MVRSSLPGAAPDRRPTAGGFDAPVDMRTNRRRLLDSGIALGATPAFVGRLARAVEAVPRTATLDATEATIVSHIGRAHPRPGPLSLDIAPIAENGSSVPVRLHVPDEEHGSVRALSLLLLAPENPDPTVAVWHFSSLSGSASVATRIRLARSQRVVAVAVMADGSWRRTERAVHVNIGGCGIENAGPRDDP